MADLDVELFLLGDNTDAASGPLESYPPSKIHFQPMFRLAGVSISNALRRLRLNRLVNMATRLVKGHDIPIPWIQRLRYLDRAANYDRFLSQANPDVIHVAHAEFRQFLSQQIVGTSAPVVASVLSASVLLRRSSEDWLVQMTKQNYNRAARLLVCSNFVKEVIAAYVTDPQRIVLVPNGTDVERFRPRSQAQARAALGLDGEAFIILYTGILVIPKGVHHLLRAFASIAAQYPQMRLVFVGSGPQAAALEELAEELGVAGRVILAGYRPDDELPDWYAACDVFALPSESEGLSISILEAMASGRPVVTTYPQVGEHDAVEPGINGLLCHYGDVEELAAALRTLLHSPEGVQDMGAAARRKAERCFSWSVIARQVVGVYRQIVAEMEGAS